MHPGEPESRSASVVAPTTRQPATAKGGGGGGGGGGTEVGIVSRMNCSRGQGRRRCLRRLEVRLEASLSSWIVTLHRGESDDELIHGA